MLAATSTMAAPRTATAIEAMRETADALSTSYIPSNARASLVSAVTDARTRRDDGSVISACRIVDRNDRNDADSHCRAVVIPHGAAVMPATNHQRELVIVVAAIVIAVPAVVVVPSSVAVFPVAAHVSAVPIVRLDPVTAAERR